MEFIPSPAVESSHTTSQSAHVFYTESDEVNAESYEIWRVIRIELTCSTSDGNQYHSQKWTHRIGIHHLTTLSAEEKSPRSIPFEGRHTFYLPISGNSVVKPRTNPIPSSIPPYEPHTKIGYKEYNVEDGDDNLLHREIVIMCELYSKDNKKYHEFSFEGHVSQNGLDHMPFEDTQLSHEYFCIFKTN